MKIVIIGAGFTGVQLAKRLIDGKNDVVLIDNDEEIVRHTSNRLDCDVIQADGNNLTTLEEAGLAKADALVCVTSSDEVNMITCSLVDSVYPKLLKIARVRNYAYYVNTADATRKYAGAFGENHRPLYGIDVMIHPDVEAADAIVNAVEHGALTDVIPFGDDYELVRIPVEAGSPVDGQLLQNLRTLTQKPLLVAYIESADGPSLPSGSTVIKADDYVGILAKKSDVPEILRLCGSKMQKLNKIALIGANRIGTIVAERLIQRKKSLFARLFGLQKKMTQDFVIIDSDEALAKQTAERFPDVKVFRADATDEAFLQEEGIDSFDLSICVTPNYDLNIIMAAFIKSLGVKNGICLVSSSAFADIAYKLDIGVAVPLRDTVVDTIMSHLRGSSVTGIHTVSDGALEILEITVTEKSQVNGKMLKDIAENGKYIMLMVQKGASTAYTLPTGNTTFSTGDNLVLIATSDDSQRILEKFGAEG